MRVIIVSSLVIVLILLLFLNAITIFNKIIRIFKISNCKRIIIKIGIVFCVIQIWILCPISINAKSRYLSKSEVISDIDYAVKVAEDVHPCLYAVISKDSFQQKVDSIKRLLPDMVIDIDANKSIRKVFALLHDGHTGLDGYSYRYKPASFFDKNLPYKFAVVNDRIFVVDNYSYMHNIPLGSEVIKINEKSSYQ